MRSPTLVLHKAQVARIEARTTYKVFDDFPGPDEAYPFIVMGEISAGDWSDKSQNGQEVYSMLHVWSQYRGRKEADEIADGVLEALTAGELDLSPDFREALGVFDSYNLIIDMDGITRHGILRMKYLIEEL